MEKSMQEIERERKMQAHEAHFGGKGRYIYENNTSGDLKLPKATCSGAMWVQKAGQFTGDSFFLKLVPAQLKLVSVIVDANQENVNESTESTLLLDQPDTITTIGKVEHVESQEDTQLNDSTENKNEHEGNCSCETCSDQVLLNEDPMDGVDIIID
jgi:hypothetical protein